MQKKIILAVSLSILCIIAVAGCSVRIKPAATASAAQTTAKIPSVSAAPAVQTEQPTAQTAEEYSLDGSKIIKDGKTVYDAAEYYAKEGKAVSLGNLIVDSGALYFTEYCGSSEESDFGNDTAYSIISTDRDGGNRKALVSMNGLNGFSALIEYKDRLFYVEDGFDSVSIGDVGKDGTGQNTLDLSAYAAQQDIEQYFSYADLSRDGDYLYAEVGAFLKDGTVETHFIKIDENLNIERIPPKEDMFVSDGSKIYKTPAGTLDRAVIYDAANYYEESTAWVSYMDYDDNALYFAEEGTPKGESDSKSFIVRTDRDGGSRQVLYASQYDEDIQICLFWDRLFYATQSMSDAQIRYMNTDGSGDSPLDLGSYAQQQGLDASYLSVSLYVESDGLHVQAKFNTADGQSSKWLTFKIDGNLNIELTEVTQ